MILLLTVCNLDRRERPDKIQISLMILDILYE
jgi:hypothetical protein